MENKVKNKLLNDNEMKVLEEMIEYPPKRLYKYVNADTCCKILENNSIRMTAPCDFNDPYDSKPIFRCSDNSIKYDRKAILEMYKKERKFGMLDKNKQRGFLLFLKQYPYATCEISYKEEIERTRDSVCKDFRVLCLTENKDNILMWSHYAQNHSGAVIEFDTEHNLFNSCRRVIYSNEAPYINGSFTLKDEPSDLNISDMKEILSILYTKSDVWKYENEWRLYFNFMTNLGLPSMLKDYVNAEALENFKREISNSEKSIHLPLFNEHITAVYLGCNIDIGKERMIVQLCKKNYPKAKIYKSVLDEKCFQKLADIIATMYF